MNESETPSGMADPVLRFYGVFDEEGRAVGFYTSDIYPPVNENARSAKIPLEAIEITEEVWKELLAKQGSARYIDGAIVDVPFPPIPPPPPSPIEVIEKAIEELAKEVQELKRSKK
jgi:hypothetical protein